MQKLTKEDGERLIKLVDELAYATVFYRLVEHGFNNSEFNKLRDEFIAGNLSPDYPERLKVYVQKYIVNEKLPQPQKKITNEVIGNKPTENTKVGNEVVVAKVAENKFQSLKKWLFSFRWLLVMFLLLLTIIVFLFCRKVSFFLK